MAPAAAAAATAARRPSPPATPTPAWATPWRSSRRCCRSMPARRTRRWPTCRSWTKAPTSCSAMTTCSCGWSRTAPAPDAIRDYVAWTLHATQALAVKIVNPGGISAFKFNGRKLDLDEAGPFYGITAAHDPDHARRRADRPWACRTRSTSMAAISACPAATPPRWPPSPAWKAARSTSPTCSSTATATRARRNFSSGAGGHRRAGQQKPQRLGRHRPGDVRPDRHRVRRHDEPGAQCALRLAQEMGRHGHRVRGRLRRAAVPLSRRNLVNALQWCIGLELFLLIEDPWRVFLTTDHPNGAPFTTYPHLIRLLMDRSFRQRHAGHHPQGCPRRSPTSTASTASTACTRSRSSPAPARRASWASRAATAISDRGRWPTSRSTRTMPDRERMFAHPLLLLKAGRPVMRDGEVLEPDLFGGTHVVRPGYDAAIRGRIGRFFEDYRDMRLSTLRARRRRDRGRRARLRRGARLRRHRGAGLTLTAALSVGGPGAGGRRAARGPR